MSMDKFYQEKIVELSGSVKMLEAKITGLHHIINVLSTCICDINPESRKRTIDMLGAMAMYAEYAEMPASGAFVQSTIEVTQALTETGTVSASQTLLLKTLLAVNAGESKLDALGEWILQATPEELTEELDSLIKRRLGN